MKLLLVNTVAIGGSIGSYLRAIADEAHKRGIEVLLAYGRGDAPDFCPSIKIGNAFDQALHGLATRLGDAHGLMSRRATERFADAVDRFAPDVVNLHNIHGYYLHLPTLMRRLAPYRTFQTLHDVWPLTGHCPFFDTYGCTRWRQGCGSCPGLADYPAAFVDRSARNKELKERALLSHPRLTLLPVSRWLDGILAGSSLAEIPRRCVRLDVDLQLYKPVYEAPAVPTVLGAASVWDRRKCPEFFERLRRELPAEVEIRLAGHLPHPIAGVTALGTLTPAGMAREYGRATVFVNPTLADNYPMCNREALACGTPVVSRRVAGSVEDLLDGSGAVLAATTDDDLLAATRHLLSAPATLRPSARHLIETLPPSLPLLFSIFDN